MGNGMNKVLPGLYLGNIRDAKDKEQLTKYGITHVVSIHDNAQALNENLIYKCFHAADSPDQEISVYFKESIDFIHNCRLNGGACLVHCMAGVSRSTTLVAAYIMAVTQLDWREALKAIKCARPIANPNYGFKRQLQDFYNLHAPQERERLKREFPNPKYNDEELLRDVMAKSENNDDSEDRTDDVLDALCRHTHRTKIQSIDKENEETMDSIGEEKIDSIGEEPPPNTTVEN